MNQSAPPAVRNAGIARSNEAMISGHQRSIPLIFILRVLSTHCPIDVVGSKSNGDCTTDPAVK